MPPSLDAMPSLLATTVEIFPAESRDLIACASASVVGLILCYYLVQYALDKQSKTQTERQKSWVLTSLSRCVGPGRDTNIAELPDRMQRCDDLDQPALCLALVEDGRC